ncbi:MAG TPA: tail fiber protein [Steroidobacteraceae bacterium]|nr:tail fiber protein [Steroidobacteraceae bacterium]
MTDQFVGEIRIFAFNFAPSGWATCDGQTLAISQWTALFALIGTYYGGNGTSTFQLPNFQGNTGVNQGTGPGLSTYVMGEQTGTSTVTLLSNQLPAHNHTINTQTAGNSTQSLHAPTNLAYLGSSEPDKLYNDTVNPSQIFASQAIGPGPGNSQAHQNMQPYLVLLFCIALTGVFPSRN